MRLSVVLQRALALALLAALGSLAYFVLAEPVWQRYQTTRDAVLEHETQIARMLRVAADAERLSRQRDVLRTQGSLDGYLIPGATPTLAAAALQNRIESVVKQSGGRLSSTQVLPTETEHDFIRVAVHVRLAVDTPSLQKILYAFESQPPLLIVDNMLVNSRGGRNVRRRRESRTGNLGRATNLDVRLRLSGWMPRPAEGA